MSYFDNPHRMMPDHVLSQAARETNAKTEEVGLVGMLNWIGTDCSPEQLAYLAEQRAIRAMAARAGHNMGFDPVGDEIIAREIVQSETWENMKSTLISAYMDGMSIGMRAQQLKDEKRFVPLDGDRRAR